MSILKPKWRSIKISDRTVAYANVDISECKFINPPIINMMFTAGSGAATDYTPYLYNVTSTNFDAVAWNSEPNIWEIEVQAVGFIC